MFWVYVIVNELGKKYTGQTNDLEIRLKRHNGELASKSGSFTKINRGPWKLIYKEALESRKAALEREMYLKSHSGREWLKKVLGG